MCIGPQNGENFARYVYKIDADTTFKPKTLNSIILPTEDCFLQGFKLNQHLAFKCTVDEWQSLNITKPMYLIEFTTNPVNAIESGRQWLQQFEDGLIEFVDRVPPV